MPGRHPGEPRGHRSRARTWSGASGRRTYFAAPAGGRRCDGNTPYFIGDSPPEI